MEAKGKTFRVFLPKTFEEKHLISAARLFSLELLHGFVLLSAQYENVPKFRELNLGVLFESFSGAHASDFSSRKK